MPMILKWVGKQVALYFLPTVSFLQSGNLCGLASTLYFPTTDITLTIDPIAIIFTVIVLIGCFLITGFTNFNVFLRCY